MLTYSQNNFSTTNFGMRVLTQLYNVNIFLQTNIRGSFKEKFRDNSLVEETVGLNDLDSGLGFDVSSNTSGSLNAEKHDISSIN